MAVAPIQKYEAAWNPDKNIGMIRIWNSSGDRRQFDFDPRNIGDFTALLQILQGDNNPHFINGWITTGAEDPG